MRQRKEKNMRAAVLVSALVFAIAAGVFLSPLPAAAGAATGAAAGRCAWCHTGERGRSRGGAAERDAAAAARRAAKDVGPPADVVVDVVSEERMVRGRGRQDGVTTDER